MILIIILYCKNCSQSRAISQISVDWWNIYLVRLVVFFSLDLFPHSMFACLILFHIITCFMVYGVYSFTYSFTQSFSIVFSILSSSVVLNNSELIGGYLLTPFLFWLFQTGTLMASGIVLFSGSCYYHALTESTKIRMVTPYGGFLLIFAWLSMIIWNLCIMYLIRIYL